MDNVVIINGMFFYKSDPEKREPITYNGVVLPPIPSCGGVYS